MFIGSGKKIFSIVGSLLVLLGVFGPWLWRGFDSYQEYNPATGETILKYRTITKISPLYFSVKTEDGDNEVSWFYSAGTTLSAVVMLSSIAIYIVLNRGLSWSKSLGLLLAILGIFVFFLSLGGGLWLGVITRFAWGFQLTLLGIMVMFIHTTTVASRRRPASRKTACAASSGATCPETPSTVARRAPTSTRMAPGMREEA